MDIPFDVYLEKEIARLAGGEMPFEQQCLMLFEAQPRLEVPMMLFALCDSLAVANNLVEYVENMTLSDEYAAHRQNVLQNWKKVLLNIQTHSEQELKELLVNADGDEMEKFGFPIPYAKYADTWYFWRNREVLDTRLNNTYRKKYQRLLELGTYTMEDCVDIFDENFPNFIKGKFDYPFEILKTFKL